MARSVQTRLAELRSQCVERLVIGSAGQVVFLNVAEIDWIEAAGYYACLHVGNNTHILRRTLSELETADIPAMNCAQRGNRGRLAISHADLPCVVCRWQAP